jgi:hypothetical protein
VHAERAERLLALRGLHPPPVAPAVRTNVVAAPEDMGEKGARSVGPKDIVRSLKHP